MEILSGHNKKIKEACDQHPNLIYMNKKSLVLDGVRVIGATLWSHCDFDSEQHVQRGLNDYYHVMVEENGKKRKLLVTDTNAFHEDEKKLHCK